MHENREKDLKEFPIGTRVITNPSEVFCYQSKGSTGTVVDHSTRGWPLKVKRDSGDTYRYDGEHLLHAVAKIEWVSTETKTETKTETQIEKEIEIHEEYYYGKFKTFLNSKSKEPMTNVRTLLRDRYFKNDGERVLKTIEDVEVTMSKLHTVNKKIKNITNDVEELVNTIEFDVNENNKDGVVKTMKKLNDLLETAADKIKAVEGIFDNMTAE